MWGKKKSWLFGKKPEKKKSVEVGRERVWGKRRSK